MSFVLSFCRESSRLGRCSLPLGWALGARVAVKRPGPTDAPFPRAPLLAAPPAPPSLLHKLPFSLGRSFATQGRRHPGKAGGNGSGMTLADLVAAEKAAFAQQQAAAKEPRIKFLVQERWDPQRFQELVETMKDEAERQQLREDLLEPGNMHIADSDFAQKLVDPDEVIIPGQQNIAVTFAYPLSGPAVFQCRTDNPGGFTRLHVARFVQKTYFRMYKEEEEQAGQPGQIPGTYNRGRTNGPYGIWGHGIDDLFFEGLSRTAPGRYYVQIGS